MKRYVRAYMEPDGYDYASGLDNTIAQLNRKYASYGVNILWEHGGFLGEDIIGLRIEYKNKIWIYNFDRECLYNLSNKEYKIPAEDKYEAIEYLISNY